MNNFYREDYFGYYCQAMCFIPYSNYEKYDIIEYFYPRLLCLDAHKAWRLGIAQIVGVPFEEAKRVLKIT